MPMTAANYDEMVESLADLMNKAFHLSMDLTHSEIAPGGIWFTPRQEAIGTPEEDDMIWGWADGLIHKFFQSRASGRCSLQAMIDFDVAKFEKKVKDNVTTMERLLEKWGKPKELDFAEMKRRGYRGSWAGETT